MESNAHRETSKTTPGLPMSALAIYRRLRLYRIISGLPTIAST
jgi:hypothetical protein